MGQGRPNFILLLTVLLAGCGTDQPMRTTSWMEKLRGWRGPSGPDVVIVDVALLERPYGDPLINQELWQTIDEQILPLERKSIIEENGFRVGQVGGIKPASLQTLLISGRSYVAPQSFYKRSGKSFNLAVGPIQPVCAFEWSREGKPESQKLENAECGFSVLPTQTKDGLTRLEFTPLIKHGEETMTPIPAEDGSGLILRPIRPAQSYPSLSFDLVLAPNQYLLIGGLDDRPQSVGHRFFLRKQEAVPVQRLLVIRTYRSAQKEEEEVNDPLGKTSPASRGPAPLALQATKTKARGTGP